MSLSKTGVAVEFAPGIPASREIKPLPEITSPKTWHFSLQHHVADKAGTHFDLRLVDPETGHAHSWALPKALLPEPGKSVLAVPQATHTSDYALNFGKKKPEIIESGYGKGTVSMHLLHAADVFHSKSEEAGTRLRFNLYKSTGPEEFAIVRTKGDNDILVNKTLTRARMPHLDIGAKPSLKEHDINKIDLEDNSQVLMPKYDGAHNLLDLREAGRIPRLFSYREPKRHTAGLIEHTHKVPELLKVKIPAGLGGTTLRVETIGVDSKGRAIPAKDIAGMLNATVTNSRAKQEELGATLKTVVFDITRYKGRDVSDRPFSARKELMKHVGDALGIAVAEIAETPAAKRKLLEKIRAGKHKLTGEGVVIRHLESSGPALKAKLRPDHDVYVRKIFEAQTAAGQGTGRAGGIEYSWTPRGDIVGRVGTGWDHAEAKAMLASPEKYIGRVAKVEAEQRYASGALGKASFKEWHLEKGDIEKSADHIGDRFLHGDEKGPRTSLPIEHLTALRDAVAKANATGIDHLPGKFRLPLPDGSHAIVEKYPGTGLSLKTLLSATMKSREPVIPLGDLHKPGVDLKDWESLNKHTPGLEHGAPTAVIIKGNPKWIADNHVADKFYSDIAHHLREQGYGVSFDAGEPHTSPPKADLWVGHSRGIDRLRFAPQGTRTLALGSDAGLSHPKDNTREIHGPSSVVPNKYHYAFTDEMRKALTGIGPSKKHAELQTALQPHQQRVVDRIQNQPGLVVAHGLGSGKTLSSIAAAEQLGGSTDVVLPAALKANYQKEIDKHLTGAPNAQYNLQSLQGLARSGISPQGNTLIVDEAHRLRNPGTKGYRAIQNSQAAHRLLLTGTPLYNRPHDLAVLVNLAAGQNVLPNSAAAFKAKYLGEKTIQPSWWDANIHGIHPGTVPIVTNKAELAPILQKWVDYHENAKEGFPDREDIQYRVPMDASQQSVYEGVLESAPGWISQKIKHNLPPSKAESKDLNAFLTAARQVSNTPHQYDLSQQENVRKGRVSPKIWKAYQEFQRQMDANPEHRAVIYSNYLESGLNPYAQLLEKKHIPYGMFTGAVDKTKRDQMVKDYNLGKLKALLLSSAGGEGLDLKGTRQMQILDPHFNKEKLEQVIGRGIRYKSHEALPEDQRNVRVEQYLSTLPEPGAIAKFFGSERDTSIDEYLQQMAKNKDALNQQMRELLQAKQSG